MNEQQQIEDFEKGYRKWLEYVWNDEKLILKKANARHEVYEEFMKEFFRIYTNDILAGLDSYVFQIQNNIDQELSFHFEKKGMEEIINRRNCK